MSGAILKSVVLALLGVTIQLVLFMIKRGKTKRLEEIRKREEEEAKERMRLMEEAWEKAEEQERTKQPQFILAAGPYVTVVPEEEAEEGQNDLGDMFGDIKKT